MSAVLYISELLREKKEKFQTFYFTVETICLIFEVSKIISYYIGIVFSCG